MPLLRVLNDILLFLFIFGMYNDNFLVDIGGPNILKIIMVTFILVNMKTLIENVTKNFTPIPKTFLLLFFFLMTSMLIVQLRDLRTDLVDNIFFAAAIFVIFYYFTFYKDLKKVLYFMWFSMMVSVVICFFNEPISPWTFRTTGGTGDPNEFGAQLASFIFLSIYLYTQNRNIPFLLSSLAFGIYGLLKAGSMSAMLTLFILLSYIAIVRYRENIKNLFSIKFLLVGVLLIWAFFQFDLANNKLIKDFLGRTHSTATAETRYRSWQSGFNMIKDNFWFGVGMGTFAEHNPKYLRKAYLDESARAAHNIYVKLFAESGALTFAAFLLFLATLIKTEFFRVIHSDLFWLQASVLAYLIMGMTLGIFYDKYFWLGIAVYANVANSLLQKRLSV